VAKQGINLGHHIQLQNTRILTMISRCMEHIMREAKEIELHPDGMKEGPLL
jgi:hypothetical protein